MRLSAVKDQVWYMMTKVSVDRVVNPWKEGEAQPVWSLNANSVPGRILLVSTGVSFGHCIGNLVFVVVECNIRLDIKKIYFPLYRHFQQLYNAVILTNSTPKHTFSWQGRKWKEIQTNQLFLQFLLFGISFPYVVKVLIPIIQVSELIIEIHHNHCDAFLLIVTFSCQLFIEHWTNGIPPPQQRGSSLISSWFSELFAWCECHQLKQIFFNIEY